MFTAVFTRGGRSVNRWANTWRRLRACFVLCAWRSRRQEKWLLQTKEANMRLKLIRTRQGTAGGAAFCSDDERRVRTLSLTMKTSKTCPFVFFTVIIHHEITFALHE